MTVYQWAVIGAGAGLLLNIQVFCVMLYCAWGKGKGNVAGGNLLGWTALGGVSGASAHFVWHLGG